MQQKYGSLINSWVCCFTIAWIDGKEERLLVKMILLLKKLPIFKLITSALMGKNEKDLSQVSRINANQLGGFVVERVNR